MVQTLTTLVEKSSTKYVLLTKKIRKFDRDFDIDVFLQPLASKNTDVMSGSVVYPEEGWSSGCYQSKLIWSQYKIVFGFDVSFKQKFIPCDHVDGPFAMDREALLESLKARTNIADELVYQELQFHMTKKGKVIKSHPASFFHTAHWEDFEMLTRDQWLDFAVRNEISEIYTTILRNNKESHFEFNYIESKAKCGYTKSMLKQRACMRDLHFMLVNSYRLFDELGYEYVNEDGSGLAAVKLHDTLPWDFDQDIAFRTENFTHCATNEIKWKKLGMHFDLQINKKCVGEDKNNASRSCPFSCGYIGIRDRNWRLESWGQTVLLNDFYQPWKLPKCTNAEQRYLKQRQSRIRGNYTKVRMGDYWCPNRPNPGYYARARYGVDMLRHAKHWSYGGASDSMGIYKTGARFERCVKEGHHLCMNQYLADGNIQFQRPWA